MSDRISVPLYDLKQLCFMARTSGGTAGRDEGLVAALDKIESLIAKHPNAIERKFSKENAHKLRDEGAVGAGATPSPDAIRREAIEGELRERAEAFLKEWGGADNDHFPWPEPAPQAARLVRDILAALAAPAREG